jgi:thiamine pyrophosphate-dependent acetolactate synthase large subunit-like protein
VRYGSDVIVDWLVESGIEYVVLNPGATIRGLHDSLVHCDEIETVLVMHEEIAIGMAHGYWKATGKPLAVFVHDLVGLQHASMALFNATIDRVPMLVIGGSGPQDETLRRPWLDWIHTSVSHTTMIRDVVKRTFEPASLMGVRDSLARGLATMQSQPYGPVYIVVDVAVQEDLVDTSTLGSLPRLEPVLAQPRAEDVQRLADALRGAENPVLKVDRPVRGPVPDLVRVAEAVGAAVVDHAGRLA